MRNLQTGLIAALVFVAAWQGIVWATDAKKFILPGPGLTIATMWDQRALLMEHAWITIAEVLIGFLLGAVLGMAAALFLAWSDLARLYLRPILVFIQAVPVFALAPILTLWFGYGLGSKIAMTLLIVYFPVTSAMLDGLLATPRGHLDLARTMGAGRSRVLWRIRVPAAVPRLTTGLRLAAVYAPIGAVIGEWVGASKGLGYLMLLANGRAKIDLMFAALLVLAAFTVIFHTAVDRAGRHLAARFS